MITDRDMRNQVAEVLGNEGADYDVNAIVSELQDAYGTVHLDQIPQVPFWKIVEKHDKTA